MSKELLLSIYEKAKNKEKLDSEFINFLEDLIPNRSEKILDVLNREIIKNIYKPSNRIIWTVVGREGDQEHLIFPKLYCSCKSFYKEVVINKSKEFCKHLIAQIICKALNNYKIVELNDRDFNKRIKEMRSKL